MKNYIDFLYDKKTEYKKLGDKSMMMTYKILMNSLYGSMLTRVENFRDFKITTNSKQADFYTKRPNFNSGVIIDEDFTIIEMNKIKCVYNPPILIGSTILQNSKVLLFDYMYNKWGGGSSPIFAHGKIVSFPIFPHGKKMGKKVYGKRG